MKFYPVLLLITVTMIVIGCGGSSSGTAPSQSIQEKVKLIGTLPQTLSADSTFSDTLEVINGHVGNVNLKNKNPDWISVKTNKNADQIIIYGKTPDKAYSQKMTLKIQGDPINSGKSDFGLSFTLSVFE